MPLRIFVEDELTDAYEILALRALGHPTTPRNRRRVFASQVDLDDLTSRDNLLDLARRALEGDYDCIVFVMDEESMPRSPDRPAKLKQFHRAFLDLCKLLQDLPDTSPLRRLKVVRVVCRRCLESWLAADPQAIVEAVRGPKGVDYQPASRKTDDLEPQQAREWLAQVINEVGRRTGRRDLARLGAHSAKSRGKDIAACLDPGRARRFNASLAYFLDMLDGQRSGCDHPFPEPR